MKKLGTTGMKWLKGIHLLAACCWVGGATALATLYFLKQGVDDGGVLYGINQSIHHVDMMVIVIPGAFGCLLTGLVYGLFTRWGFFRHGWVLFKWVFTVGCILFGTFYLGVWETSVMEMSGTLGLDALKDPAYIADQAKHFYFGLLQLAILATMVFVSVFKPWKGRRKTD